MTWVGVVACVIGYINPQIRDNYNCSGLSVRYSDSGTIFSCDQAALWMVQSVSSTLRMGNSTLRPMTNEKHSTWKSSTILIFLGTYPNDQPMAYTSPRLYVMPRYVTKPRISSTGSDYSSTNCARNISPKNVCWQPWRNVAGRTPGLWKNTAMGWTIIWPMIVGALIHEAGTVIQAPKPVCQFMAEDIAPPVFFIYFFFFFFFIPPPVLNPYPTTSINSTSHKVPSQPSSQD